MSSEDMPPKAKSLVELAEYLRTSKTFSTDDLGELERSMCEAIEEIAQDWENRYHVGAEIKLHMGQRFVFSKGTRNKWEFSICTRDNKTLLTNCGANRMMTGIQALPELERSVVKACEADKGKLLDAIDTLQRQLPNGERRKQEKRKARPPRNRKRNRSR